MNALAVISVCIFKVGSFSLNLLASFLLLHRQSKDKVSAYATETTNEYMNRYDADSFSWMISRIIDLVEKIKVLLIGGKKVEIKLELQKVIGYLQCFRGSKKSIGSALVPSVAFRKNLVGKHFFC